MFTKCIYKYWNTFYGATVSTTIIKDEIIAV